MLTLYCKDTELEFLVFLLALVCLISSTLFMTPSYIITFLVINYLIASSL